MVVVHSIFSGVLSFVGCLKAVGIKGQSNAVGSPADTGFGGALLEAVQVDFNLTYSPNANT